MIPLYQPSLSDKEKMYVNECLDTTWISSKGKYVNLFEKKFAKKNKVNYALTVCNGTVALHLSLMSLGIGKNDEIIVPTLTYIASVNAIFYTGAKPVFVDSLTDTWQINPKEIEKKINSRTKAIIVVHLYGHPCDMDSIMRLAKKYNLFVIEDCAEALGSKYKNKPVGTFGHISTYSFFGNKTITTGEGGMVTTNSYKLYNLCKHLKSQGLKQNYEYWHDIIGYNYRMTNICAAIGLAQLQKLDNFVRKKRTLFKWYEKELKNFPLTLHKQVKYTYSSYWLVNILVEDNKTRNLLRKFLKMKGIETRPVFNPIHKMPMYYKKSYNFPIADNLAFRGISLPSWPGLRKQDILKICKEIKNFFLKIK